jgi:hypothetical protein
MKEPERLQRIAHHEAGHAVVCFLLYGEQVIKSLTVESSRFEEAIGSEMTTYSRLPVPLACRPPIGEPRRGNPAPVSGDAIVDAHGVLSYAGVVAEELRFDVAADLDAESARQLALPETDREERALRDRETLSKLASIIGVARPVDEFFEEYWHEARRLLRSHWSAVDTLARELAERGTLNGDRVDTLLRTCCGM